MADRIFPTHVNEDPLDSEMVFQGINWDNFNNKLAEVKEAGKTSGKMHLMMAIKMAIKMPIKMSMLKKMHLYRIS